MKTPLNVVIPMAGSGKRFAEAGYGVPKPLISIHGKPMVQRVIENIKDQLDNKNPEFPDTGFDPKFHFVMTARQYEDGTRDFLEQTAPGSRYCVQYTPGGAVPAVLEMRGFIANDEPLLIANSDQLTEFRYEEFLVCSIFTDGFLLTFKAETGDHYSFCELGDEDDRHRVTRVAEKQRISDVANVGIYYYAHGLDFCTDADSMMKKDIRHAGEFYVAPVYNESIARKLRIVSLPVQRFDCLGTPTELEDYLRRNPSGAP